MQTLHVILMSFQYYNVCAFLFWEGRGRIDPYNIWALCASRLSRTFYNNFFGNEMKTFPKNRNNNDKISHKIRRMSVEIQIVCDWNCEIFQFKISIFHSMKFTCKMVATSHFLSLLHSISYSFISCCITVWIKISRYQKKQEKEKSPFTKDVHNQIQIDVCVVCNTRHFPMLFYSPALFCLLFSHVCNYK